jgi:hypothetical protein
VPEARQRQAELTRAYGIHGFCYYRYWFNVKRMQETPLEEVLRLGQSDFPFLMLRRPGAAYRRFHGATPAWDNTARMGKRASVFVNSSPDLFRRWLTVIAGRTVETLPGEEQIVFINAWNEWAEGCHLEPDSRHGHAYLEACRAALDATRE